MKPQHEEFLEDDAYDKGYHDGVTGKDRQRESVDRRYQYKYMDGYRDGFNTMLTRQARISRGM